MKKISLLLAMFLLVAISVPALAEDKNNAWGKAATEISEAAEAIGDATKDSLEKGKDATSKMWDNSKSATAEVAQKATDESIGL